MKALFVSVTTIFFVLLSGCSSSPSELLVGKWKFDHMEMNVPEGKSDFKTNLAISMAEMQFSKVTMEYFADGTYETSVTDGNGQAAHGKYWLESDDKYICTKKDNSDNEKRTQIVRISSDTLVIGDEEGSIVMVRVE